MRPVVESLRGEMNRYMVEKCDLGFFPECIILEEAEGAPSRFGQAHRQQIASYIAVADLQQAGYTPKTRRALRKAVASDDPVMRWWGLTTLGWYASNDTPLREDVRPLLADARSFVQSRATVLLSMQGDRFTKEHWLSILNHAQSEAEVLLVLNDLTYAVEQGLTDPFELKKSEIRLKCSGVDWRLKYLNACAEDGGATWNAIYR